MKKYKIYAIVILLIISFSLSMIWFLKDIATGLDFLPNDKLLHIDQFALEDFYTECPETISEGKVLDVKYIFYKTVSPTTSEIAFLFKGDKPKRMKNVEIYFDVLNGNTKNEAVFIKDCHDGYDFYDIINYKKYKDKVRFLYIPFDSLIGFSAYEKFMEDYGNNFIADRLTFVFNFSDGTSETHTLIGDKEKSLKMNSYELDKSMDKIISDYDKKEDFIPYYKDEEGDLNKLIMNLNTEYFIYNESAMEKIYNFFELINNAKNKDKIIRNEPILNVFASTKFTELDAVALKKIMKCVKTLYTHSDFNDDAEMYTHFYDYVKKINEVYEDKTGEILVPKYFDDYEVDEIFNKLKLD
ncbi:MAG: hypothetical protein EOM50_01735 [Erysipelotrichia bacterium]|nr:hypothetical protein [Erysipelotrichia bacterium]